MLCTDLVVRLVLCALLWFWTAGVWIWSPRTTSDSCTAEWDVKLLGSQRQVWERTLMASCRKLLPVRPSRSIM